MIVFDDFYCNFPSRSEYAEMNWYLTDDLELHILQQDKEDIVFKIVQMTIPKRSNVDNNFVISFDYAALDLSGTHAVMDHEDAMAKFKKKWSEDVTPNVTNKTMKCKLSNWMSFFSSFLEVCSTCDQSQANQKTGSFSDINSTIIMFSFRKKKRQRKLNPQRDVNQVYA